MAADSARGKATVSRGRYRRLGLLDSLYRAHKDGATNNLRGRFIPDCQEFGIFRCRYPANVSFASQLPEGDTIRVIVENPLHLVEDTFGREAGTRTRPWLEPPLRDWPVPHRHRRTPLGIVSGTIDNVHRNTLWEGLKGMSVKHMLNSYEPQAWP